MEPEAHSQCTQQTEPPGAGFVFDGENLTEAEVRDALASVFGEHDGKVIGDAAIPAAMGENRKPFLPPADGSAGGRIIALDWYCKPDRFRLRVPAHSPDLVRSLAAAPGRTDAKSGKRR